MTSCDVCMLVFSCLCAGDVVLNTLELKENALVCMNQVCIERERERDREQKRKRAACSVVSKPDLPYECRWIWLVRLHYNGCTPWFILMLHA